MKFMIQSVKQLKALLNDRLSEQPIIPKIPIVRSGGRLPVLVLDLDETLVYCCNFDGSQASYQVIVSYPSKHSESTVHAKMTVRPHAREFLEEASLHYDLVVYTASESDYAVAVCQILDPERKCIQHIYSREFCVKTEKGFKVKDLRFVVGQDTSKVLLLDNSAYCFAPQIHNGIPVLSFTYEENDSELLSLLNFLRMLKDQSDMIEFNKSYFQISKNIQCSSKNDLQSHLRSIGVLHP
jgi:Dullard-like phosphatase family protein